MTTQQNSGPVWHATDELWAHMQLLAAERDALQERIAQLEAQLAAVPRWVRITDDPETHPEKPPCVVWLSVVAPWELHLWIWSDEFELNVGDWWYSWHITPPEPEP